MDEQATDRQQWLSDFAHAELSDLETFLNGISTLPEYDYLRTPEIGLIMVRGRMGGTGKRFNLGEATASRCSIKLKDGPVGHGYCIGRSRRKAEVIALFDAMLQISGEQAHSLHIFLEELRHKRARKRHEQRLKTAATKVNFLTANEI